MALTKKPIKSESTRVNYPRGSLRESVKKKWILDMWELNKEYETIEAVD